MQGDNCIIWSGDRDLMQLVNYNPANNAYSVCYDSTRKVMGTYPGFEKWLKYRTVKEGDTDIFNVTAVYVDDMIKQELESFIKSNKIRIWPIYCDEFIFTKILTGDKSDNISSVVQVVKPTKTGKTRTTKISDNKALQILKEFKMKHKRMSVVYLFDDEYKNYICSLIRSVMKIEVPLIDLKLKLEQNIKLMLLHTATIPDAIQGPMFDAVKEDSTIAIGQYEGLLDKDEILEKTTYIQKKYIPASVDPFANSDTNTLF
jgi:5'-3' exonuclease